MRLLLRQTHAPDAVFLRHFEPGTTFLQLRSAPWFFSGSCSGRRFPEHHVSSSLLPAKWRQPVATCTGLFALSSTLSARVRPLLTLLFFPVNIMSDIYSVCAPACCSAPGELHHSLCSLTHHSVQVTCRCVLTEKEKKLLSDCLSSRKRDFTDSGRSLCASDASRVDIQEGCVFVFTHSLSLFTVREVCVCVCVDPPAAAAAARSIPVSAAVSAKTSSISGGKNKKNSLLI